MAAPVVIGQYNRIAYFYASQGSIYLGLFSKDAAASVMCRLDYSQLTTLPGGEVESFSVDIGSNPPLAISSSNYNQSPPYVDFILSGGVPGQEYQLSITITGTINRTDLLVVDVPLTSCDCASPTSNSLNVAQYPSGLGLVYINSVPKYTVSTSQPQGANVKDQWFDPSQNLLFEYVTDGVSYWWQQMAVTTVPTFATNKMATITPDGVTTQFNLKTVGNLIPNILVSTDLIVVMDGVVQEPDVVYKAYQNQIQFTVPPRADSVIFMVWFAHY